jgi:hypothetical protein
MIRSERLGAVVLTPVPRRADPPAAFRQFFRSRRLRGSISPAAVDSLAAAIQTQEGYYPGSLSYQNNNPGNLVYVGQPGASPGAGGFASFNTYANGLSALKNQITLDATRGTDANGNPITDVADLLNSWAPASDPRNNPDAYIASVTAQTGYDPYAPLSTLGAPTSSGPTFSVDVFASPDNSDVTSSALSDLSAASSATVDLSSIGLSSAVPWWWIAAGLAGVVIISRS